MAKKIKWNGLSWEVLTFDQNRTKMRSCKLTNPGE